MTDDLLGILRTLANAAFTTGGITDGELADVLGKLDAAAQPAPPADPAPEQPPADTPPADTPAADFPADADV